jgi:hypothetical protein
MDDFYTLPEELRAEYEREYNEWLDNLDLDDEVVDGTNSEEEDLFESYDENYTEEDEQVIGYDDLVNYEEEAYRELDFN